MSWLWWTIGIYAAAKAVGSLCDALYGAPGLWIGVAMQNEARRKRAVPQEEVSQ